jgi:hypothetical protein
MHLRLQKSIVCASDDMTHARTMATEQSNSCEMDVDLALASRNERCQMLLFFAELECLGWNVWFK